MTDRLPRFCKYATPMVRTKFGLKARGLSHRIVIPNHEGSGQFDLTLAGASAATKNRAKVNTALRFDVRFFLITTLAKLTSTQSDQMIYLDTRDETAGFFMFDSAPKEREALSWAFPVFWSALLFATVPHVRDGVNFIREHLGSGFFTFFVAVSAFLAAAAALYATRQRWSLASCAWLLGLAALVVYLSFDLAKGSAEEAIHYVQYGMLSFLLFRAFSHRIRDYSIYVAVTVTGTFLGMVDETVQWLTSGRYFDLRDIWLNFKAVALVQIGLAAGIQPKLISGFPGWESLRRLCLLGAVSVGYLGFCLQNTPDRIIRYAHSVPGLGFIDPNQDQHIMVEYGHLHGNPDTVSFRSRMTGEELRRSAAFQAEGNAPNIDHYNEREKHEKFMDIYSPLANPFLYEARIHQLRRDVYLKRAMKHEAGAERAEYFATAYWENYILEKNFGDLLHESSLRWSPEQKAKARTEADLSEPYESGVSRHLIVNYSPRQTALIFSGMVAALLFGAFICRRASQTTLAT